MGEWASASQAGLMAAQHGQRRTSCSSHTPGRTASAPPGLYLFQGRNNCETPHTPVPATHTSCPTADLAGGGGCSKHAGGRCLPAGPASGHVSRQRDSRAAAQRVPCTHPEYLLHNGTVSGALQGPSCRQTCQSRSLPALARPCPPLPACRAQDVQFLRCLMWQVVRMQHHGCCLQPRVKRFLPVGVACGCGSTVCSCSCFT